MNEHEVTRVASLLSEQLVEGERIRAGQDPGPDGKPRTEDDLEVGQWKPSTYSAFTRVHFISAKSVGENLVCCFTLDEDPHQYLLCFNFSDVPLNDDNILVANIENELRKLAGSASWETSQNGILPVSRSLTIVLPSGSRWSNW